MHLFFDLDGTLTDSSPGIVECIRYGLNDVGRPDLSPDGIRGLIGSPLAVIFERLLDSSDVALIDRAIAAYRVRFNEVGLVENSVYPGIIDALQSLREAGHDLQIVTAKQVVSARRVVKHFDLARFFDAVHGPDPADRTCDKSDFVAAALARVGHDRQRAAMIGDRVDDVLAARAQNVASVAVTWGYGSREELEDAQPTYIAESVAAVLNWVNAR